jgi:PEGA domain
MTNQYAFRSAFLAALFAVLTVPSVLRAQEVNENKVMGQVEFHGQTKAEKTAGVWVDGQYVGTADELKGTKEVLLLPGQHQVSLRQTGYLNFEQDITVNPHRTTVVDVQLQKDPNAEFSGTNAQVKLEVTPDRAAVLVDGKFAGTAHDFGGVGRAMLVAPGKHHVVIDLVGYQPFTTDIDLQANQKVTIKADLIPGSVSQAPSAIKKQ